LPTDDLRVAVILPCYNEEHAIVNVINDFKKALPDALVYVFDNNSTDRTADMEAGVFLVVSLPTCCQDTGPFPGV
jgi:GT2 family glycosyltransferase